MTPRSNLDLAGQASEDEQRPHANSPLHSQLPPAASLPSGSASNNNTKNSDNGRDDTTHASSSILATPSSGILSFLPSPIDLWDKRTATSLLLLPIVFCIYVILQLPLHYNAKNNVRTANDLSETEWKGRAREVDELSSKLHHVKNELKCVNKNHKRIKGTVQALRHRLHHLKVRRGQREVYLNTLKRNYDDCTEDDTIMQQEQNKGVAKDGPLASLSIVKAAGVATFVGKTPSVDAVKKED
ncbi:hypothetical protein QTG54_016178 [Skeletonema marinoi]|uniref:Uncharacterized protein n=1 Tax=Skeletonema marinoi TaxID=267567 RepID=A0AAD8XT77_9STRA|nr:hypothetical protein QTG54_016178 [Skeletonema marinoi]